MKINEMGNKPQLGRQNTEVKGKGAKDIAKKPAETTTTTSSTVSTTVADTFTKSTTSASETVTYSKDTTSSNSATSTYVPSENMPEAAIDLAKISEERILSFQNMLMSMVGEQFDTITSSLFDGLSVTLEESQAAQEAISDGGEWSPEAVATRLLDMAKALSGGDDSKLELLRDAVTKGFEMATAAWGSEMPEITSQTYDLVMKGFDEWAEQASGVKTAE